MEPNIRLWQPQWFLDPITRLPNRTLFLNRLNMALAVPYSTRERLRHSVAVFIIEVYEYAFIKEQYGRRVALGVLREAARRMALCIGPGDTLARFGEGTFAVLREIGPGSVVAPTTAARLRETMGEPFALTQGGGIWTAELGGRPVMLRLSPRFGAVIAPTNDVVSSGEVLGLARYAVEIQVHDRTGKYEDPGASCFFVELLEPAFIDAVNR